MHRTHHKHRTRLWGVLLAFLAGATAAPRLCAQVEPPVGTPPAAVNLNPAGLSNAVVIPIGGNQLYQMSSKRNIARGAVDKPETARIQSVPNDPTRVLISGQQAGVAHITLTDVDGKTDTIEVVVQLDVEYLRLLLRTGAPNANVDILPGANGTIILRGYLTHAEDVALVLDIAKSVVGDRVINGLRVGGVQQVQLDVVVAQVSRSKSRSMSFTFDQAGQKHFIASTLGLGGSAAGTSTVGITASSASLNASSNLTLGLVNNRESFFGFLQALKNEGVAKLLAEPRLITLTGRSASFLSGGEQAIPVPAGLGQVGVQFEEFGTRLNFLPIVLGDGRIHLEVEPEVSSLTNSGAVTISGATVQGRSTQRVHTTVEMEPGQTFVIGGLIQHELSANATKVPIIGEVPFLGAFFSSKADQDTEQELLVIVTPYLVDAMDCSQLAKYLPGQETRTPDDFELFLEGILEAPRGPRTLEFPHGYQAAYKNSPSAGVYPCAGPGGCGKTGTNGSPTCGSGTCAMPTAPAFEAPLSPVPPVPASMSPPITLPPAAPVTVAPLQSGRLPGVGASDGATAGTGSPALGVPTPMPGAMKLPTTLPPAISEREP